MPDSSAPPYADSRLMPGARLRMCDGSRSVGMFFMYSGGSTVVVAELLTSIAIGSAGPWTISSPAQSSLSTGSAPPLPAGGGIGSHAAGLDPVRVRCRGREPGGTHQK